MKIELELTEQQVDQLRQVMDWLPLNRYAPLICAVNKALPLEPIPAAVAGSFAIRALTPKGDRLLPDIARILGRLEIPHGDSL